MKQLFSSSAESNRRGFGRVRLFDRIIPKGSCSVAALLLAAIAITALSSLAHAQVLYGTLTGSVTDPSGAVVAGAQVTALEVQTGVSHATTTGPSGIYRFGALFSGTYKVTVAAKGFSDQEISNLRVNVNEIAPLDVQLHVASAAQDVTVTTAPPLLQTESADVHTDFSTKEIADLPIMGSQGANFQELLRTIPGAGLTAETI